MDKPKDEITADDYDLEKIELGPATTEQEIEDLSDSIMIVQGRLRVELENNKKLERELNTLKNYVQQHKNTIRQADPSSMPPSLLPPDLVDDLEEMRKNSQVLKSWIDSSFTEANKFMGGLAHVFDTVSAILDRTQVLKAFYEVFVYTRDFTIPRLQVLMDIPRQTLMNAIVKEGHSYDFCRWYSTLRLRREMFEGINSGCN